MEELGLTQIKLSDYVLDDETVERLFGHEAAEREDVTRLKQYFIRRFDYDSVIANLPLKIVTGFKGVGKSAVLKVAYEEDLENGIPSIWVRPDDISELYTDLTKEDNFLRLITLWKKGLARLIACRIAQDWLCVTSHDAEHAISWAEEAGYRTKDLISQLAKRMKPLTKKLIDTKSEKGQKVGEHRTLERLLSNKRLRIYIDDLDRGWEASERDRKRLSALINALGDLTTDIAGLQARISLRTDVYTLIREHDESTDKFESNVVSCSWTNHDILIALITRLYSHFNIDIPQDFFKNKRQSNIASYLSPIFRQRFEGTPCWDKAPTYRVIMSLIRRRPRDMVKLCTFAAKNAHKKGSKRITGEHFVEVLQEYSNGRMGDIVNEFKSEMPDIRDLLYNMGPTKKELRNKRLHRYVYTTDELYAKIKNVLQNVRVHFSHHRTFDFHDVAHFLYKIGFINARNELSNGLIDRVYYEDKKQLLLRSVGDMGYAWEIHPAYRGALYKRSHIDDNWGSTVQLENQGK